MGHLGRSNAKNEDKQYSSERQADDDDDVLNSESPASISAVEDASAIIFYKERHERASTHNDNHSSKQRRSRTCWLGALTILSCFMGGCIFLRFRNISIDTSKAFVSKTAVLTFDTWQDVITQSAAAYKLLPPDRETLQEDEELLEVVETKSPANTLLLKKRKKNKFATFKNRRQSFNSLPSSNRETTLWDVNGPPVRLPDGVTLKKTKVWDVNGPPVRLPDGVTLKKRSTAESSVLTRRGPGSVDSTTAQEGQTMDNLAVPPSKTSGVPLHASEALQCRDSVINFVINATDSKDECDGLIKAFDKTCSNDEETGSGRRRHLAQRHHRRKRTRRLWDKVHIPYAIRWRVLVYRTLLELERCARYLPRFFGSTYESSPFFFAEDEVFKAWDAALYLVENSLDGVVQSGARRNMHKGQCVLYQGEEEGRRNQRKLQLEEAVTLHGNETTAIVQPLPPATNKTKSTPSTTSLQLPIKSQQHVSDKFANDALLLQQGEKIIKELNKELNETSVAKEEAAKSKKSISDTADAVSAVLNDPTSVEARTCCASILNVYHELCSTDDEEQVSDTRLFFLVFVMACCGMVKSLIRHFRILWLPEAAGCIVVGVLSGYALDFFPHHDISFDGNWFLRILVPPIIFEAALSIDKRSFNRHLVPILIYAVAGTLVATFLTAMIVHYGTTALSGWCAPIPYVEALTFGALISSIDPIAVLSVLSNMGMNDTDTIYVLIFGESLLNDGVAIVLFHTLVHFLDETLIIDREAIIAATVHFFVVAFGSLLVGVASGIMSTVYFWIFYGCQTPLVEVLMFVCWALLPYYVCDGIGWSGIVAAVAVGFVMDLHIVGQTRIVEEGSSIMDISEDSATSNVSNGENRHKRNDKGRHRIFNRQGHLSTEARAHVGFVTEIIATGMETAIFAYLGFFLFSHRYHWNFFHMVIAILACCISRAIMIPSLGFVANWITRIQQNRVACRTPLPISSRKANNPAGVIVDKKMQVALWFAGLRGAMSFALVEHIPLYDSFSGEGTRLKPELKAMTSASIMFTVFVLGGYTFYMMQNLGIAPSNRRLSSGNEYEIAALLSKGHQSESDEDETEGAPMDNFDAAKPVTGKATAFRRQRHTPVDSMVTI